MMENRYPRLSLRSKLRPRPGRIKDPTLPVNNTVLRTPLSGVPCHLPLTDNIRISFLNAGMKCAALIIHTGIRRCQ